MPRFLIERNFADELEITKDDVDRVQRNAKWAQVMVGVDPDPANKEKISAWARDYWKALHPHSAGEPILTS